MFGFLKKVFISPAAVNAAMLQMEAIGCWREAAKCAQTRCDAAPQMGKGEYIVFFWENAFKFFYENWRKPHPLSEDPKDLLKQKCDFFYEYIYTDLSIAIGIGNFTDEEVLQIGEFIAVAIILGLEEAIFTNAERAAIIYDYLPYDWFENIRFKPEMFDQWYFEKTGKKRLHRNRR